jgi:hypothetical protein
MLGNGKWGDSINITSMTDFQVLVIVSSAAVAQIRKEKMPRQSQNKGSNIIVYILV